MNKLLKFFLLVFSITQAIALGSTSLVSAQPATGAVISNRDENGIDQGNLNITTNTLEIQDLQDTDQSKTTGGGINISGNGDNLELSSTYASKDKQGTTKATIGQGSITVNNQQDQSQLALLNRDINNSQETTRDWETERVDTTLKVDTRVFTEEGRKSIKKDFLDTKNHAQEIAQAVEDVATTDKSLLDFGSQVHKYATDRQLLAQKSSEQETQDKLKGEEGAEGSQQALEKLSDELSQKDGLTETAEVNLYDGSQLGDTTLVGDENDFNKTQAKAGYHEANQHIYINIDQTDMTDSSQTVRALVHEQERHTNAQNGSDYSEQSQTDLAKARGERAESVWNDYSDLHGIETKSTTSQKNWNQKNRKSQEVETGTKKLAQVESEEVKPLITPDTIWDIANIAYDLGKAGYALAKGDEALLEEALKDLAADTVAALIPGLPAGTSKLAKIAAKKLKDGKKLTKKESEALSQAVEAKKAQRQGEAQTPSTRGTSKSGGSEDRSNRQKESKQVMIDRINDEVKDFDTNNIQFGGNSNQKYHAWRHIDDVGIDKNVVRNAILKDINSGNAQFGVGVNSIVVNGRTINYSLAKIPSGKLNIGSIY